MTQQFYSEVFNKRSKTFVHNNGKKNVHGSFIQTSTKKKKKKKSRGEWINKRGDFLSSRKPLSDKG